MEDTTQLHLDNSDSFDQGVIHRIVHSFYEKKEYPTVSGILEKVKEQCWFRGGRFCMWHVLRELGFSYKKRDGKQYIYEQRNIIQHRHAYLQTVRKLRQDNTHDLIDTDETWVNAHHTNEHIWVDSDGKGGWKVPSGKGQRLIVMHTGGVEGWVDGAGLVFKSKTNLADYHNKMNSEHYVEWLTEQPSVIILDNASYHNKQKDKPPTSNSRKDEIREWLDKHNIQYSDKDIKTTLLGLIKQHRPKPLYLTDKAIHEHGHLVLRLPVSHCELNPIELAWASVKDYVAKHNKHYNMGEVERLVPDSFEHTMSDMWRRFCRHVLDIENEYFEKDGLVEDVVEEMVICLGGDENDSDEEDEEGLMDDDDRQLICTALQQTTSTCEQSTPSISIPTCTTPTNRPSTSSDNTCTLRQQLMEQFDTQFLRDVLPLQMIPPEPHSTSPGQIPETSGSNDL